MAVETSADLTIAFARALVGYAARRNQRGRGAQTWLVEKGQKARSQIKYWFSGQDVPGQKAIRDFLRSLRASDALTVAEEDRLRLAWQHALEAKWDVIDATGKKWPRKDAFKIAPDDIASEPLPLPIPALGEQIAALTAAQQLELARLVHDMRGAGWADTLDLAARTARTLAAARGVGPLQAHA